MAAENTGILTNAGQDLLRSMNAGQTKITYTKVVFSTDDNSKLADADVKALTDITTKNVTIQPPVVTKDPQTGETIIRAVGTNKDLTDGIYIHTYGVYAKDDTGKEILYGVTVTSTPDYLVGYDGMMAQAVAYSYRANIQDTDNVNFTDAGDVYVMLADLQAYLVNKVDVSQLDQYAKKTDLPDTSKFIDSSALTPYAKTADVNTGLAGKQDKLKYTVADDSTVVHKTGDEEIAGTKTFDTAPVDKTSGKPYITSDGVPAVPSTLADTTKLANFTAGLQSGGVSVATSDDLKSVAAKAWLVCPNASGVTGNLLMKDNQDGTATLAGALAFEGSANEAVNIASLPDGYTFNSMVHPTNTSILVDIFSYSGSMSISFTGSSIMATPSSNSDPHEFIAYPQAAPTSNDIYLFTINVSKQS